MYDFSFSVFPLIHVYVFQIFDDCVLPKKEKTLKPNVDQHMNG